MRRNIMSSFKRYLLCFIVIVFTVSVIIINNIKPTYALTTIKDSGKSTVIPVGYHFAPRYIEGTTTVHLCDAPSGHKWVAVSGVDYYQLQTTGGSTNMPLDSYKGKIWVKYKKVGFYNDSWLDMKITILDWNAGCKRIEFGRTRIGVGNATSATGGTEGWMNIKVDYYYAGTDTLYSGLKGHQPVGDMDYWSSTGQGEWLKTGTNSSTKIIIPSADYSKFDLSKISSNMIGVNSTAGGGIANNDGINFVYLFESPSHTITWYGGFLGMNMACPIQEFQVNYISNGGIGTMDSMVVKYGTSTKLAKNKYSMKGYTFSGWHVYREFDDKWNIGSSWQQKSSNDQSYNHYADRTSVSDISTCGNVYMYACWNLNSHDIAYNLNGGEGNFQSQKKVYGQNVKISENIPVKEGYEFKYWTTTSYDIVGKNGVVQYFNHDYIRRAWLNILDSSTVEILVYADNTSIIEVPVWTLQNGQDDLIWHTLSKGTWTRGGETFNYGIQVSIDSHNGEVGEYLHHIYAYDGNHSTLGAASIASRGFIYHPGDVYAGYQNGGTQILYAQWEKVTYPPQLTAKTNYYFKDSYVEIKEVLKNAYAEDREDGNITNKISISKIEYPDGSVVEKPVKLKTSVLGNAKVTYRVVNTSRLASEVVESVYIVEEGSVDSIMEESKIYSRFISKEELDDGKNSFNTLSHQSIWLTQPYKDILIESLDGENRLLEYNYINNKDYLESIGICKENEHEIIN